MDKNLPNFDNEPKVKWFYVKLLVLDIKKIQINFNYIYCKITRCRLKPSYLKSFCCFFCLESWLDDLKTHLFRTSFYDNNVSKKLKKKSLCNQDFLLFEVRFIYLQTAFPIWLHLVPFLDIFFCGPISTQNSVIHELQHKQISHFGDLKHSQMIKNISKYQTK